MSGIGPTRLAKSGAREADSAVSNYVRTGVLDLAVSVQSMQRETLPFNVAIDTRLSPEPCSNSSSQPGA